MAIKAYKGFNEDFTCRGFQFEIGKTYTYEGKIQICESGFHACENPFDIWWHYHCITTRYAAVTLDGILDKNLNKIAAERITIAAEISLRQIIEAGVEHLMAKTNTFLASNQLAASGNDSQLAASGDDSQLAASGDRSQLAASGDRSWLAASGNDSQLAALGDDSICAVAAIGGRAKVGKRGTIALAYFDGERFRIAVAYEGENGIEANTWYEVNDRGEFLRVSE